MTKKNNYEEATLSLPVIKEEDITSHPDIFRKTIDLGLYVINTTNDNSSDFKYVPEEF